MDGWPRASMVANLGYDLGILGTCVRVEGNTWVYCPGVNYSAQYNTRRQKNGNVCHIPVDIYQLDHFTGDMSVDDIWTELFFFFFLPFFNDTLTRGKIPGRSTSALRDSMAVWLLLLDGWWR